ncbi:uncharacterized protein LOC120632079 [Pararge aegeria]|uniref:uncharacterized protein LOC120632079 n=1 Tax=Pararge aegeria TaxID=116150 RepID=UPI0019D3025E|nr:uncharacterized protein LOC120632079 [Pararge aegeria]
MTKKYRIIHHENVDGAEIGLRVDYQNSPYSQRYTIYYRNGERNSILPYPIFMLGLMNAVIFICGCCCPEVNFVIFSLFLFIILIWLTHTAHTETVLVIPTVGIQCSVEYMMGTKTNFVPWSSIEDVIVNEVIKLNQVICFLTIVLKPSGNNRTQSRKLIPLFKITKPRALILETLYLELQTMLMTPECTDPDNAIARLNHRFKIRHALFLLKRSKGAEK